MSAFTDRNNPGLSKGDQIDDYCIERVAELKEISSFFYELVHTPTGARHIHISNDDAENTFSVAFKTVPSDSTGVAHILEHTALCGSGNFPVRDPFFSMLKRSLSTFMNAFTASDWTMYPFSTQNRKDFYNLMDVYLDAAFFPKLDRLSFKQEGHRLEPDEDGSDALVYKGVVYNEMKGAMSSPDQILGRSLMKALYPSTTYSNNSGGEPADIPSLTYEQLIAFHKRHYHPSNAFFYTYGNLPLKKHLAFIQDKILGHFERIDPKTDVPSQPRWQEPRTVTQTYPLAVSEDPEKKCQICLSWLTADIRDTFEVLALALLEHILLGNSASPLRKALIDSELGSTLSDGTGFDADNRDTSFTFGLKDVKESAAPDIERIITEVLKDLADNGIDKELIASAIHQAEFHRKEITNHPYPYGIKLVLVFSGSWFHGGDPARILRFDEDLRQLNEALTQGPFFENKIRQYFLDNLHRVLFKLVPDHQMEQKENERVQKELEDIRSKLSPAELEQLKTDAELLEQLQETEEDLSQLPTLELGDIPPSVEIVRETGSSPDSLPFPVAIYQKPTSGIFYFDTATGVGTLPADLLPFVPFFCHAFSKTGTKKRDYTELARRIDAYTGGISMSPHARNSFGNGGGCLPFIAFGGKCLERNQEKTFDIISELLFDFDFSDLNRLRSLLLEYRAGLESMIVHNGHGLAISLAARNFSLPRSLSETWGGVHQLQTIKGISDKLTDDTLKSFSDQLTCIGKHLFTQNNFKIALVGEESALSAAISPVASVQQKLGKDMADGFVPPGIDLSQDIPREGWSTSSAVSFVARVFETVRMEHEDSPALAVISKILRSLYLHREIREKGGAYGGFAIYNPEDGLFCFGSYRDPHIVATLNVYDAAHDFIRSGRYSDEDVKEAILQVCSEIDKPDPPGPAARKAFYRKLISLSDEAREHFKKQLLLLNKKQVMAVAERYFDPSGKKQAVVVISGEEKLKAANDKLSENPLTLYSI